MFSGAKRSGVSSVVGLLACQNNSYLKSLNTKVVTCEPAKDGTQYEIELEDTVLFPEGGGQPYDVGHLTLVGESDSDKQQQQPKQVPVTNVQRDGLTAVHFVKEPLEKGQQVVVNVDWRRRFDHMQQHTGQHLLSAILDKRNLETLSWNMGTKFNYIELPRKLTSEEVSEVQKEVNDTIRQAISITVEKNNDVEHKAPEDYDTEKGVIRVIHIGELDSNPCCGTHLKNTAEIGTLSLLHSTPVRGTNSRLWFMAGDRVATFANEANDMLRKAGSILSCQMENVEDKLTQWNQSIKELYAKERYWSTQVAKFEAEKLKSDLANGKLAFLYKPDNTADYLKQVEKEVGKLKPGQGTMVLVCGKGKAGGAIVAAGDGVDECVTKIQETVPNVKGGGKGRYSGKVLAWEKGSIENMMSSLSIS